MHEGFAGYVILEIRYLTSDTRSIDGANLG